MARITEQDVHTAAAALDAQGIKPTTSKIREKLGSGSFSTIAKFLTSYEGTERTDETPEAPEELAAILPAIWAKAWEIASAKFESERTKYNAIIFEKDEEINTLQNIIEGQEKALETALDMSGDNEKRAETAEKKLESLKEKNAYLQGVIDANKEQAKPKRIARTSKAQTKKTNPMDKNNKTEDWTEKESIEEIQTAAKSL